ncbi:MAG: hypothetical protein JSV02_03615 [Dehalococcoidia bacterium]|nr:MAG: hypothetical protein JSV02_03615 [Dehalococcoidia bacterium]
MYDFQFPDESLTTWTMIRQTWAAINKVAETKLSKINSTPEKVAVLWACRDYPSILTPAEISRLVFRENQTVAGLLNRMEKEGLVKRIPKRKGHPFTEIKLTPKGEQATAPGIEIMKRVVTELLADMPKAKQEQLRELLLPLRDKALDQLHIEPTRPRGYESGEKVPVNW